MFEHRETVLPLSRVEHLAGCIEHGTRVRPGHQPSEEDALEPRRTARRARADRQRFDGMPVAENDVAAPGQKVTTQQQRPEPYGPVADEGAFAKRAHPAGFSLPSPAPFSLPRLRGRVRMRGLPLLAQVDAGETGRNARLERLDDGAFAGPVRTEQGDHRTRSTQPQGPAMSQGSQHAFPRSRVLP